ncbi:MAG: type I-E CRISPR-associated protein Cse2/CasB [Chloroflexota bacterium]
MTERDEHPFIAYLESLTEGEKRGALSALRRGLGRPPGSAPEMYPYVIPFLPEAPSPWQERAYYLVASLFAFHSVSTSTGNMGDHMAAARVEGGEEALERRFTALLAAHPEDLPDYLRQAISYLKAKGIAVNWDQLLRDVQWWGHPDRGDQVRKRWATAFWRWRKPHTEDKPGDVDSAT